MLQDNGAAEKATRRRALLLCGGALVALLATLKLLGVFGHFQRSEAVLVDASDSKVLAGANIVALYTRSCVGSDDANERTVILSRETISDDSGAFVLEEANLFSPPGPKSFTLGLCQFADEPQVYIAKPDYVVATISGPIAAEFALTPLGGDDDLDGIRLSIKASKELLSDTLLATASPAFYTKIERDLEHMSARYKTLHRAHVDTLQEQLKEMSRPIYKKQ